MNNRLLNSIRLIAVLFALINTIELQAQNSPSSNTGTRTLLVRDSLDFKNNQLTINTPYNEFSPNLLKGGLLYVSNKPSFVRKGIFNRIYWSKDPSYIISEEKNKALEQVNKAKNKKRIDSTDEFTPPTSNDNDILFNYRKHKKKLNAIEQDFIHFSTDQAFAYNDSTKVIVYAKKARKFFGGKKSVYWQLWKATLKNGKLTENTKIIFKDKNADYLYPFIDQEGAKLYFASNIKGGKGGFDIYYISYDGKTFGDKLMPVSEVNTSADEVAPSLTKDAFYFSSNKEGGLGGFDIYSIKNQAKKIQNLGYPINSNFDEVSLKNIDSVYFLTTNRSGNFDIVGLKYEPVFYPIKGVVIYKNDGTLAPNHQLFLKDGDTGEALDTLISDANAKYAFTGKPNRNYVFVTLNGDSILEEVSFKTIAHQTSFDYITAISGRSPKQRADSIAALLALEQRRLDSITQYGLATKFIVRYGFNKSNIAQKEKLVLDSLLIKLNKMPNTFIVVGAFTDCIGSYKYNYQLSVKRAKSVVAYLINNGLDKNRIISNGYSKKYNVTPCVTKYAKRNKDLQQNSRRAEIVLSDIKKTNWERLEKERGAGYYKVYDASGKAPVSILPAKTAVVNKQVVSSNKSQLKPTSKAKDTGAVKPITKPIVENKVETELKAKAALKAELKVDTVAKVQVLNNITNKPTAKKDTVKKAAPSVIIASPSKVKEDESLTKEDIVKALDSLAKLKREQERIVEYLTKRINKKPIDVFVSSDSVTVELYDNGIHDKDSVSVIYNNRIIVDRQELKVNKPIKFKLKVDKNKKNNELVLVAENLGIEPPNTAVMFITEKSGKRQQVMLSTDMTHNEVVYFIRIGKE
jgi:outer membrane protein OmpA-like peptidoglycan-associated protein